MLTETTMPKHLSFKDELYANLEQLPGCRPYISDGAPTDCKVFIVGCNPATAMETSFSKYILDDRGTFDLKAFMNDYTAERGRQKTKTGRQKSEITPTRRNLEEIRNGASPTQILETNVYSLPSPRQADLSDRNTNIFKFLVGRIKPEKIVLHGDKAKQAFEKLYNCTLVPTSFKSPRLTWNPVKVDGKTCSVLALPHLAYGCSRPEARRIGESLR
jgi:hypothetical protein